MENPGLEAALWAELDGGLWHATSPAALTGILADGAIRPFGDRFSDSLSRALGGVSLFDFGPTSVAIALKFRDWSGWFGRQQNCRVAVWLEVDRAAVTKSLHDAGAMCAIRQSDAFPKVLKFIAGVEACHQGPLPISALRSTLLIDGQGRHRFRRVGSPSDSIGKHLADFQHALPSPPPTDPLATKVRTALSRRRHQRTGTP